MQNIFSPQSVVPFTTLREMQAPYPHWGLADLSGPLTAHKTQTRWQQPQWTSKLDWIYFQYVCGLRIWTMDDSCQRQAIHAAWKQLVLPSKGQWAQLWNHGGRSAQLHKTSHFVAIAHQKARIWFVKQLNRLLQVVGGQGQQACVYFGTLSSV